MTRSVQILALSSFCLAMFGSFEPARAQVHYHSDGRPWKIKTRRGPDAVAGGWYYNLGVTGMRGMLVEDRPTAVLVKFVFDESPAHGKVQAGDFILGANGSAFTTPHRNGYGVDVFGGHGPLRDFGLALDESLGGEKGGQLALSIERDGKVRNVQLNLGTKHGAYAKHFPERCDKSSRLRTELCEFIVSQQKRDGSWGSPHTSTFAALALLASDDPKYMPAIERTVRYHARTTKREDESWLINWRYMAAGIVLSEFYLKTKEKWVLPELQEIYDFLLSTQYVSLEQVAETARKRKQPRHEKQALGGWGHNPGFEGYGPIAKITAQGALTLSLMKRCGIDVDRARHDMAYDFLNRGTGKNGYLWYADSPSRHDRWADMGRTGTSAIAHHMSPYADDKYAKRALRHARAIGDHPETLPDTHGSPLMGMGYTALGAFVDPVSFRRMMESNRWWFTLAECHDGTFYYQPNRDNNPNDFTNGASRLSASATVAFILSFEKRNLAITAAATEGEGAAKKTSKAQDKLKVFILAGQSNMEGHGQVVLDERTKARLEKNGTFDRDKHNYLEYLAKTSTKKERYRHLLAKDGSWATRSDVWFYWGKTGHSRGGAVRSGLTVGLGAGDSADRIGPELQLGHLLGEHFEEPVLLIKTAWGGKSLAVDFRPPSAGLPSADVLDARLAQINERRAKRKEKALTRKELEEDYGRYYRLMLKEVDDLLEDIKKVFPYYDETAGYEVAGFVWFQGWNDGGSAEFAAEYTENMKRLVADVRSKYGKDLPVVIGSSGFGKNAPSRRDGWVNRLREHVEPAQIAAAKALDKVEIFATGDCLVPHPDRTSNGGIHHWFNSAESYFLIGDGLGKTMLKLLD